ncbi:MAG: signal recognition particle-docking protein FtsY, partial [Candidatus Woesearchaeota archaeon]
RKELKKRELEKIEDQKAEEKIKEALKEDDVEEIAIKEEKKEESQIEIVEEPPEIVEEELEEKKESKESSEEKKGFFKRFFSKKEENEEEGSVIEVEVPEKYNPATQKYEPDLGKIQELEEEVEKEESKEGTEKVEVGKKGFFGKIKQSFTTKTISASKFEELFWDLELALLENNVSVEVIDKIKEDLKEELVDKPLSRNVEKVIEDTLQKTLKEILSFKKIDLLKLAKKKKPLIIAFFGVNGAGKTTSIAKLTYYFQKHGHSVVLAACDTFRAAAIQQLEEHADRLGVKIIKHDYGSDAAAVAFDAVKYAEKNKIDIVMIDTAGRLHSNTNLMQELEKIIRVTKPDVKLFVGESITGNDCIEQAKQFNDLVEMDGAILTKADVDEKGGAPLSIAYTIKKPILFLGMGQEYQDLEEFSAEKIMERLGL